MIVDVEQERVSRRRSARGRRLAAAEGARLARRDRAGWRGESAAIYCRISLAKDEDQTGVDRQERICRQIAERLGLVVDRTHVFVDNNRSAWQRNRKRAGWDALLEALHAGRVRHVIAYHPDRLMRQPRDLEELLTISDERNITLHGEANQRDLSDPDDRFFLRIEVAHACRSSDDTSRRQKAAMVDRARDGRPHGGKRRYGYTADGMTVVPAEAEIVREVFGRYLDGESAVGIAKRLNARGVVTALGRRWTESTVLKLLDSRHVAGIRVFRGEEIGRGEWPAIIDEGMWKEVRARREYRGAIFAEKRKRARFYLLRGLVVCKRCGTHMPGANGYYLCNRGSRGHDTTCVRRIVAGTLERFVVEAALRLLENLDVSGQPAEATALAPADSQAIEADERELADLKDMWDSRELTTREYRQMRKTVEDRINAIRARTVIRPTVEVLEGILGSHARARWQELETAGNVERMNAILRFLFAAVIIDEFRGKSGTFDYDRVDIEPNPL